MKSNGQPVILLRSAAELAGVTLFVFTLGWIGVWLAEVAHQFPIHAGRGGVIEMRLAKSDRHGDVSFVEAGYSGWWNCRGKDWSVEWRFTAKSKQPYHVEVLVAAPDKIANEKIAVTVHDQAGGEDQLLQANVAETAPGKWQTIHFGEMTLGAGPFVFTVKPGSDSLTNLNVRSATLRPKEIS